MTAKPRIGVCFFGILRNLSAVLPSIEAHVLAPAREYGQVDVLAHLFRQSSIENYRSGERGAVDLTEADRLGADEILWEEPDDFIPPDLWARVSDASNVWGDEASARNLLHQLRSLERVTDAALARGCDVVVFARPDLRYHDSLAPGLATALRATEPTVVLPWWQGWGGYNDRFAVAAGAPAISAYGHRGRRIDGYLDATGRPFHSERLLRYALSEDGIRVVQKGFRASRVRIDGSERNEIFERSIVTKLKRELAGLVGLRHLAVERHRPKGFDE